MDLYNDVNDWLLVGGDLSLASALLGQTDEDTIAHLMGRGVTHVLDARIEWEDSALWIAEGLYAENYAHLPITDSWKHNPDEEWFCGVEDFVRNFLAERKDGEKIYVHCHMGVNRGPSAAMLALLTEEPTMTPWHAFLAVRAARSVAGLVYAEHVGVRHIVRNTTDDEITWATLGDFRKQMNDYWTPSLIRAVNKGISFYRSTEGDTRIEV